MFTGLVEEVGNIAEIGISRGAKRITVHAQHVLGDLRIDDSIAMNGVCLTVIHRDARGFAVEAVDETLRKTTIGSWQIGKSINLERALTAQSRLGGHFVQGHVDGLAKVTDWSEQAGGRMLSVSMPAELVNYLIPKGSITLDGVSLTIAAIKNNQIQVALIPHTLEVTTLGAVRIGDAINVEADMLGKYVRQILSPYIDHHKTVISHADVKLED